MIKLDHLQKKYGYFELNISMEIPEGRITGLVGKNGAGKSTTIKAMLGLVRPDAGTVTIFGKDATALTIQDKQRMGVALAESGFSSYLCPGDVAAILDKLYDRFDYQSFLRKCQENGLPEKKQIKEFSTGMKAKLRVLVALSHEADLLILDEPTAGLDVEARNEILDILRDYMMENEQRSVLITSHIATDLEGLCDDIYLIHDGKVLVHEETDVILSQYAVLKASEEEMGKMDQSYILKSKKEGYGYACLTSEKQYYMDNYPELVIEKCGIDDLILILTGGK